MTKKTQILNCVKASKKHLISFNKTHRILHLQQSGNKIYKAYVLLIEAISRKKIHTPTGIQIEAQRLNDSNVNALSEKAEYLNSFWYQGTYQNIFVKRRIRDSIILIKLLLKKYKIK